MRRNKKSRILAILLVVSMIGSSAVYVQAAEVSITPAAEAEDPDTDIEICGEEHEICSFLGDTIDKDFYMLTTEPVQHQLHIRSYTTRFAKFHSGKLA